MWSSVGRDIMFLFVGAIFLFDVLNYTDKLSRKYR